MKHIGSILVLAIVLAACATLERRSSTVTLSAIEGLQIGQISGADLRVKFGNPDQIASISKNEDAWIYNDDRSRESLQRASFVLDKNRNVVVSAVWMPDGQDPLSIKKNALAHFKGASFRVTDAGWVARHEYSSEAIYSDQKLGLSIRVNEANQSVLAIGFGGGRMRPLATQD